MSWRFLFILLLLAAGASAWGGVRLGEWLVAHGPATPVVVDQPELSDVPVLDADGKPFMAQPPQPLINGQQGIPQAVPDIAWHIDLDAFHEVTEKPSIPIATTTITMDEALQIVATGNTDFQGIADVGNLGLGAADFNIAAAQQPIPAPPLGGNNQAWQNSLSQELKACSALGFFDRPSCAWGRHPDCPAKSF